jgi:hypothetical protein
MQKTVTVSGAPIVRQLVKFGNGDVRQVRFVAQSNKVTVTSRGLPRLVIKTVGDAFQAFYCPNSWIHKNRVSVDAMTAEQAYKKIVAQAWAE